MSSAVVQRRLIAALGFSVPFAGYHVDTGVISVSVTNVLLVLSATYLLGKHLRDGSLPLTKLDVFIATLVAGLVTIGVLGTVLTGGSFRWLPTVTGWFLLLGVVSLGLRDRRDLLALLHALFLAAVLIAVLAIVSSLFHVDFSPGARSFYYPRSAFGFEIPFVRTVGITLSHGEFGMFVTGILPLYVLFTLIDRNRWRGVGVGIIIFAIVFIVQGRSTWLAMLVGLGTAFFLHPLRWWLPERTDTIYRRLRRGGIVISPVVFLGLAAVFVAIGGSLSVRIDQIMTSIVVITENPLIGVGWGTEAVESLFDGKIPHNAFLRIGVALGGIAFVFTITVVSMVIVTSTRLITNSTRGNYVLASGVGAGFAAVLVEINFLTGFGKTGWLWIGILVATYKILGGADGIAPHSVDGEAEQSPPSR